MKRSFSFLFTIVLVGSVAFAQTTQPTSELEQNLRRHVEYLASDKLEGRKTGEPGATAAAGYVANQFAKSRLRPGAKSANGKANFLQIFPYVAGVMHGKDNLLRIIPTDRARENKMEAGGNYQPFGNSINGYVPPTKLVFAGYGIMSADKKYDDYAGLDVKGMVVLVLDGTPDANNPHSMFGTYNIHTKANIAKERGAKAMIVIASNEDFKIDARSRLSYEPTAGETAIPVVAIARDIAGELFTRPLSEIEKQQAETRPVGIVPVEIKATAQIKVDLVKKNADAYNVIGILEGTDPTLKNEAIIIGAHYDHLGKGGQGSLAANSTDIHHGADDNASGTAAVIELARHFASEPRAVATGFRNKRTLIFMAFGGEEEGLLGSKYYVNNPVWPLDKTVAMINLDMVGRLNENKLTVGGIGTAGEWSQLVQNRNISEYGIAVLTSTTIAHSEPTKLPPSPISRFSLQLNEDGFGPSDHSSFYGKQIPVLFFFTGTHLDYHKPSDTFEKINYEGLTKITTYVAAIAKSVDENPTRPTYKVAQASGNMTARTTFTIRLGTIPSYASTNDGLGLDGVRDGSPAGKAGLKAGDKIIKLAGKDVRNISDYMFAMSTMKAGEEYEVIIKRGAEALTLKIVPAPAAPR